MVLIILAVALPIVLLIGMVVGAVTRGYVLLPSDRRRLERLASELYAQARIDAITRSTVRAMHDVVRAGRG